MGHILFPDETISSTQWMRIFPYGIPQTINGRLASAAEGGYLVADSDGFRSTEKGKIIAHQGLQAWTDSIAHLHPLPPADLQRLVDYLVRLSDASFAAPEPPPKFCLTHYKNYKSTFDHTAPLIRLFFHYFKELDFYRMDSHMAAWRVHNLEGNRWEVFSEVWGGKNNTLDKIFDELSFRGITRDEYASILQELAARGWVQQDGETYQPTAEGKRIREEAETLTDTYFFAPWNCLVVHTKSETVIRIISARKANKYEEEIYSNNVERAAQAIAASEMPNEYAEMLRTGRMTVSYRTYPLQQPGRALGPHVGSSSDTPSSL